MTSADEPREPSSPSDPGTRRAQRDEPDLGGVPGPDGPRGPSEELPVANSEFEDEPPGAYLQELRVGAWAVAWTIANFAATVLAASVWWAAGGDLDDGAAGVLAVLWALAPISAWVALATVLWLASIRGNRSRRGLVRFSWLGAVATLLLWAVLRWGVGVDIVMPDEPDEPDRSGASLEVESGSSADDRAADAEATPPAGASTRP